MLRIPGPLRLMAAQAFAATLELTPLGGTPALTDAYAAEGTADVLAVTTGHLGRQMGYLADCAAALFDAQGGTEEEVRRQRGDVVAAVFLSAEELTRAQRTLEALREALAELPVPEPAPETPSRSDLHGAAGVVMAALTADSAALIELVNGADAETLQHLERISHVIGEAVATRDTSSDGRTHSVRTPHV